MMKLYFIILSLCFVLGCTEHCVSESEKMPLTIAPDMFDNSVADTLGLPEIERETITIFSPQTDEDMKFNNHPQLAVFKGYLYACWQGHPLHETSDIAYLFWSRSKDGISWSKPVKFGPNLRACGGLWATDKALYVYSIVADAELRGDTDRADRPLTEIYRSTDGLTFEPVGRIDNAMPSESPQATSTGRLIMPCHGLGEGEWSDVRISRFLYTDNQEGVTGWQQSYIPPVDGVNVSGERKIAKPVEPSWFTRKDGKITAIFRDLDFNAQTRSWRIWAAVSNDDGKSFSELVLTDMPDSDSMQCAGNLPDGTAYMINNPVPARRRVPLAITLSKDGINFNHSFLVRGKPQERRFEGISKTLGYSYPGSLVWTDYLYIAYATNKEDIEITRISLDELKRKISN